MAVVIVSGLVLLSEIIVATIVFSAIRSGYRGEGFSARRAWYAVAYELVVNVGYMLSRSLAGASGEANVPHSALYLGTAIFHGIFSLSIFIVLILLLWVAGKQYRAGRNFFREHARLTVAFAAGWGLALFSGIVFFALVHLWRIA